MTDLRKPSKPHPSPRSWNSSMPIAKKKIGGTRKARPLASKPLARKSKIKPVNPDRLAKRRAEYRKKLAAYKKSETYKFVEARCAGGCEHEFPAIVHHDPVSGSTLTVRHLCAVVRPERLTHHHKTYARFGGKELPEDIIVLCDRHNKEAESKHPTRNRRWR